MKKLLRFETSEIATRNLPASARSKRAISECAQEHAPGFSPAVLDTRKILIKKEAETSEKYGCSPEKRSVKELLNYGIINVNKPRGPTSHLVSEYVKKILHVKKAGHGGSLDPNVTGVLPVAIGRGTRIVQTLLKAGKEYVCLMRLHKDVKERRIRRVCSSFIGCIEQVPPVKSAVKRVSRKRDIYYLEILEIDGRDVLFKVGCQAGTYIRKLVSDIGKKMGVKAHMEALIRTKAGPFNSTDWITLEELEDAYWFWKNENNDKFLRYCIKPVEKSVKHLKKIWILDSAVESIVHGSKLHIPGIAKYHDTIEKKDLVAVMTQKDELVALGTAFMNSENIGKNDKGLVLKPTKVFMLPNIYS